MSFLMPPKIKKGPKKVSWNDEKADGQIPAEFLSLGTSASPKASVVVAEIERLVLKGYTPKEATCIMGRFKTAYGECVVTQGMFYDSKKKIRQEMNLRKQRTQLLLQCIEQKPVSTDNASGEWIEPTMSDNLSGEWIEPTLPDTPSGALIEPQLPSTFTITSSVSVSVSTRTRTLSESATVSIKSTSTVSTNENVSQSNQENPGSRVSSKSEEKGTNRYRFYSAIGIGLAAAAALAVVSRGHTPSNK
jgi:hypothetical protein